MYFFLWNVIVLFNKTKKKIKKLLVIHQTKKKNPSYSEKANIQIQLYQKKN